MSSLSSTPLYLQLGIYIMLGLGGLFALIFICKVCCQGWKTCLARGRRRNNMSSRTSRHQPRTPPPSPPTSGDESGRSITPPPPSYISCTSDLRGSPVTMVKTEEFSAVPDTPPPSYAHLYKQNAQHGQQF